MQEIASLSICKNCGLTYKANTDWQKYCSDECRDSYNYKTKYSFFKKWMEPGIRQVRAEYSKEYLMKNGDRVREKNRKYYADHKVEIRKRYKFSSRANMASRRIKEKNAIGGRVQKALIQKVYEDNIKRYGTLTCILCDKPIDFGMDSLEHLTPLSRGGTNLYENLNIAHISCNRKKNTKTFEEWKLLRGTK